MIIQGAATLAYDENEVHITIKTEPGEVISVGDTISIPMDDHSFEEREVVGIFKNWKKWRDGKSLDKIENGDVAEIVVEGIDSGYIHTISSPYIDEILGDECVSC